MLTLRAALFTAWLYLTLAAVAVGLSPTLLMPHSVARGVPKVWAWLVRLGLRWIMGVRVEVRGRQHRPKGAALVAAKHQSMLDTIAPFLFLDDACFVMKKELMPLPFLGWFAWKTRMIPVDRSAHAKALKDMVRHARARLAEGRQIVIFPEGTRGDPDQPGDYKPGVAAIYRDLDSPCALIATNSGRVWPAHGLKFKPGVAVFEFLEPIPAGLKRAEFMAEMERRLETASAALG